MAWVVHKMGWGGIRKILCSASSETIQIQMIKGYYLDENVNLLKIWYFMAPKLKISYDKLWYTCKHNL